MEDIYHLFPVDDTHSHKESDKCPCNPEKVKGEKGILIVHNAFDGRDFIEESGKRIETENN